MAFGPNNVGPVLELTLDRADKRNAVNDVMLDAMIGHLAAAGIDESVRVIRIDAEGPDFCAGSDLIANNAKSERKPRVGSTQRRLPNKANRLIPLMLETQVPIVAVVRGWAAGLGFHIAMASDFCVAADDARFWEPFMSRGFTPDSGAAWLLPRLIGMVRTRKLLMLGEEISGTTAAEWGIIHSAHNQDQLGSAAEVLVTSLGESPTVALGLTKWLLQSGNGLDLDRHYRTRPWLSSCRAAAKTSVRGWLPSATNATHVSRDDDTATNHRRDDAADAVAAVQRWVETTFLNLGGRPPARAPPRCVPSAAPPNTGSGTRPSPKRDLSCRRGSPSTAAWASPTTSPEPSNPCWPRCDCRGLILWGSTTSRPRCSATAAKNSDSDSFRPSCATRRSGVSCSVNRVPVPTWRRLPLGPCATGTAGSSRVRRSGPHGPTRRISPSCWPARIPTSPSTRASRTSCSTCISPASRCDLCARSPGRREFNEVFLDGARVPDAHRVGDVNNGWRVSASTLSSERQMVSGSGSGGMGRLGGSSTERLITLAKERGRWDDPVVRHKVMRLWAQEQIRGWTNARVRAALSAGQSPGAASSIGKVHQATLNQQIQDLMVDLLGTDGGGVAGDRRRGRAPAGSAGNDAQPCQQHRGRNHRHQQEHSRRASTRVTEGAGPMERATLEGDSALMTDYERLIVEKADGIGWLILNRPEAGNAFDARMLDELEAAWTELDDDPNVRVIVNTANGKAFCTGMDVVQVARDKDAMRRALAPHP